jgi:gamma-glutamylcyclotransferase (GGCT)/AIG2-like uncharacterized protein YtfP
MKNMKKLLAVYGTLKQGYPLHYWLTGSRLIQTDKVKGSLYLGHAIPYLLKGNNKVFVEVYQVDAKLFDRVVGIEENAGYRTELTQLESGIKAYVFFYPKKFKYMKKINKF